jgi:ParB family chromosome partitioning protein
MDAVQWIPVAEVIPGDNDREDFDPSGLQELAASIAEHGLAQPITVRQVWVCPVCRRLVPDIEQPETCPHCDVVAVTGWVMQYQIVAGERRWRAHCLLQREQIPALVRRMSDEQASSVMLLENIQRAELNPMEEARAYYKRMVQFDWDETRVAQAASVSAVRVRLRLTLLDLVAEAQDLVRDGQLGVKYAYVMRDLDSNRQRIALRYLSRVDTPKLKEFRELCARLLAEQAQEALFDMAAFMTEIQEARDEAAANRPERIIPVNESLPGLRKARAVNMALERYIRDLLDAGEEEAARVVGTVYQGLLAHRLVKLPEGPSPLIPGETL